MLGFATLAGLSPLLLAAGVAVKLDSRGPVLFRQTRMGRDGQPFRLIKLRTMRVENSGLAVTASDDPRITKVGRLLRRTKIDELPQLWNLVRGDISLVGPRPEVPDYVDLDDPVWQKVLTVRPGITDPVTLKLRNEEALLDSVPGDRDAYYRETLLPYKLQGNLRYLATRSWKTDASVILRTLWAITAPGTAPAAVPTGLRDQG
ncbi:MAG: sugar transferase [Thermoleophilia bacterium]|nr:sugar transferase [Thermoleophilia bacterium]